VATDPALEILARHNAGHEHQVVGVEDLVQQPVVTDAMSQKRVARALKGLACSAIRYGVDRSARQLVVWPLCSSCELEHVAERRARLRRG